MLPQLALLLLSATCAAACPGLARTIYPWGQPSQVRPRITPAGQLHNWMWPRSDSGGEGLVRHGDNWHSYYLYVLINGDLNVPQCCTADSEGRMRIRLIGSVILL